MGGKKKKKRLDQWFYPSGKAPERFGQKKMARGKRGNKCGKGAQGNATQRG